MKKPDGYLIMVYNYPEIIVKTKKEALKIKQTWKKEEEEDVAEIFPFNFATVLEI